MARRLISGISYACLDNISYNSASEFRMGKAASGDYRDQSVPDEIDGRST